MDKQELKMLVAQLLQEMDGETIVQPAASEDLPDLTKVDIRAEYHVPHPENKESSCA